MRRVVTALVLWLTCGWSIAAEKVGLIKIDGAIGPATASYISRSIDEARAQNAQCLIVQLNKRFSHGLQGSVAYTWSHAIDYNVGAGNDALFFDTLRTFANGNYRAEKGSSSVDQRP